eukprot:scaffold10364_cov61-Attheya_sp.AAC.2
MEESPSKKRRNVNDADAAKKDKAKKFHQAIMADLVDVGVDVDVGNLIKGVMRSVPDHYSATARNIIIREDDHTFWNKIIADLAKEGPFASKRVVVVGSPGIGKSTTAAYAIRLLWQKEKTIVYKYRTEDDSGYYVEFTPSPSSNQVTIELYPEQTTASDIPSLLDTETYYLVDPGRTKTSCNPGPFVLARVVIVASPDEQHWGGSGFRKNDQTTLGGEIRYFPAWTLPQLQAASTQVSNVQFQNGQVAELYSIFGGVPRQVFDPAKTEQNKNDLKTKVEAIPDQQLQNIVTGQINRHSGFGADQPGSGVVEFVPYDDFQKVQLKLISSWVLKWVRTRFMDSIWTPMVTYPSPISWQLLEDYMLHALQNANQYTTRPCVGKTDGAYNNRLTLNLGECTGMSLTADCTASVFVGSDLTVFYSSDKHHPLYDMIYKDGTIYHAFQITEGKSHDAKQTQIKYLAQQLQIGSGGRELRLYYAVHEGTFDSFVTNPVAPNAVQGLSIFHLKLTKGLNA